MGRMLRGKLFCLNKTLYHIENPFLGPSCRGALTVAPLIDRPKRAARGLRKFLC